ncbi:MAG TPA: hypothetical protein VJ828_07600 [Lacipirellulaceae bacterium]|nr:hypothetical protein [Lacipirellulaceae bacterium]
MRFITVVSLLLTFGLDASGIEFFVLQGIDRTHPDDVLQSPGLDGFTIRVSWKKLQDEGFAWLDEQVRRGDELNVNMQLRVLAGASAPADLPGVAYFDYQSTEFGGAVEMRRVPVPWDPIMRAQWQELATNLGSRYGDNPRIKVVHVPSFANSSELHMPIEVTQIAGYSSRGLAESWAAMAAPLAAAFPHATVSLNYATPTQARITGDDSQWLIDELAILAADRAGYQANDLAADVDLARNKYQTLVEQHELGRQIGFQMVSSSNLPRFGGDFLEAVDTALQAGAQWLEIYAADIVRIPPPGDYNLNGTTDAADYIIWRATNGQTGSGLAADGDANNRIDAADYQLWRANFGVTSDDGSPAIASAPEPSSHLLLLPAAALLVFPSVGRKRGAASRN